MLVDKPAGWTSFDVCAKLRGALRTKKIGHAGTLDPMATGLLIVCTGRGTKWVDFFQAQVKGYTGSLRLGEATPSYDAETEVSERSAWEHVSDSALQSAASTFLGSISQVPPMYSALKQNGVPLYVKARAGVVVERAPRQLLIERFDVERAVAGGPDVRFAVVRRGALRLGWLPLTRAPQTCSKGTYIRSLAHDLGAALGTHAHLTELRRVSIGDHAVDNAWPLDVLIAAANAAAAEATV